MFKYCLLFISLTLALSACSTFSELKAPCSERASGKTKINQW